MSKVGPRIQRRRSSLWIVLGVGITIFAVLGILTVAFIKTETQANVLVRVDYHNPAETIFYGNYNLVLFLCTQPLDFNQTAATASSQGIPLPAGCNGNVFIGSQISDGHVYLIPNGFDYTVSLYTYSAVPAYGSPNWVQLCTTTANLSPPVSESYLAVAGNFPALTVTC
jgi:hypothetical protein